MNVELASKQEAYRMIKERMAQRKEIAYSDVHYDLLEVEVYKTTFTDGKSLYLSLGSGEQLKQGIEKGGSGTVSLGEGLFRLYEFKNVVPTKVRFASLSDWAKRKVLEEQPDLFAKWEDNFSPRLKERLEKIKQGKGSKDLRFNYPRG